MALAFRSRESTCSVADRNRLLKGGAGLPEHVRRKFCSWTMYGRDAVAIAENICEELLQKLVVLLILVLSGIVKKSGDKATVSIF